HLMCFFFFSSRRRHTRSKRDWSSDVCSSDLTSLHVTFVCYRCDYEWGFSCRRCRRPTLSAVVEVRGRRRCGCSCDSPDPFWVLAAHRPLYRRVPRIPRGVPAEGPSHERRREEKARGARATAWNDLARAHIGGLGFHCDETERRVLGFAASVGHHSDRNRDGSRRWVASPQGGAYANRRSTGSRRRTGSRKPHGRRGLPLEVGVLDLAAGRPLDGPR